MKTTPVQNYDTIHYVHPLVSRSAGTRRWMCVAYSPSVVEHDEIAVLGSHPQRRIDAVLPASFDEDTVAAVASAVVRFLCGEEWELKELFDPAEPLGFDHDAF